METRAILEKLRRGEALVEAEFFHLAKGLGDGTVSDAQAGAFAMGVCKGGLSEGERIHLTNAMRASGDDLVWDLPGPLIDKHSTGGVGDCASLVLAPALAACGAFVPMISGRGLGHTGGTLDKLESIPGLSTELSAPQMQAQVGDIGCAIVAASHSIAPADRRLYGVRDITGTVESVDLIVASILSKKLAEGLEALVLDVKLGSGAFMGARAQALTLARALVGTAQGAGCMTTALVTDMNQPCVRAAGNALELIEVMRALTGQGGTRLLALVEALGGEALALGGMAADAQDGAGRIAEAIASGRAAEIFGRMVVAQGGPADFLERWRDRLPAAPVLMELQAEEPGVLAEIDTRALGEIVVRLGGGRLNAGDRVNPAVGVSHILELGTSVTEGQPVARVHASDEGDARDLAEAVFDCFGFADGPVTPPPLIVERIA